MVVTKVEGWAGLEQKVVPLEHFLQTDAFAKIFKQTCGHNDCEDVLSIITEGN